MFFSWVIHCPIYAKKWLQYPLSIDPKEKIRNRSKIGQKGAIGTTPIAIGFNVRGIAPDALHATIVSGK